jgi:hypothetical protein
MRYIIIFSGFLLALAPASVSLAPRRHGADEGKPRAPHQRNLKARADSEKTARNRLRRQVRNCRRESAGQRQRQRLQGAARRQGRLRRRPRGRQAGRDRRPRLDPRLPRRRRPPVHGGRGVLRPQGHALLLQRRDRLLPRRRRHQGQRRHGRLHARRRPEGKPLRRVPRQARHRQGRGSGYRACRYEAWKRRCFCDWEGGNEWDGYSLGWSDQDWEFNGVYRVCKRVWKKRVLSGFCLWCFSALFVPCGLPVNNSSRYANYVCKARWPPCLSRNHTNSGFQTISKQVRN